MGRILNGLTRFLRTERGWFTPTHDAVLLKKGLKAGAWCEIGPDGRITERAKKAGFLPGWTAHLPEGVGKVMRSSLIEHDLDTIHKLKQASKMQVQAALGRNGQAGANLASEVSVPHLTLT